MAVDAISAAELILLLGCLSLDLLIASSFLNIPLASGVSVIVGAIQFTLISVSYTHLTLPTKRIV